MGGRATPDARNHAGRTLPTSINKLTKFTAAAVHNVLYTWLHELAGSRPQRARIQQIQRLR
ncbi:hypothetical protein D8M19_10485 [Corynebacterium pseudodiphtheriticum]|nr:hypothetical protein D8M19_10485 [Corynebacterium pseudodiphtheriticum]